MVMRLELRASGALGEQPEADTPSELSSFHGNVDGNLRLELGRSHRGEVCHRATDSETKVGQASMHSGGGACEYGDNRSSQDRCTRTYALQWPID